MTVGATVDALDDRSVLLSLQEFTEPHRDAVAEVAPTQSDAAELVSALLAADASLVSGLADPGRSLAAGRALLSELAGDPATEGEVAEILADPPADRQLSVAEAAGAAVVLGALVTWLQTKVDIHVSRKDGKTEFEFRYSKKASRPATLEHVVEIVAQVLRGRSG
jgi:hypothetical protein